MASIIDIAAISPAIYREGLGKLGGSKENIVIEPHVQTSIKNSGYAHTRKYITFSLEIERWTQNHH